VSFTPEKIYLVPIGLESGWAPKVDLDGIKKRKFLTLPGLKLRPLVVQPLASRCANFATAAHYGVCKSAK
jgi:hypothetical protein